MKRSCLVALWVVGLVMMLHPVTPAQAAGRPILYLPTPAGETWEVIQGYNCGTHNGWDRMSFDLVNADGRTRGAPVTAAADGTMWYWGGNSGSLIISHGGGYYTMYSHMQSHINVARGTFIARGTQIGTVGSVNPSPTVPHLHLTFFSGTGASAANRQPLSLSFAEGYDFPDTGGCNAYAGSQMVAAGVVDTAAPTIEWSNAPAQTWINTGQVEWSVSDDRTVRGFSQAWDADPAGDAPAFEGATTGYMELSAGKHTAFVRAWDTAGNQTLATREVWYDPMPPSLPADYAAQKDIRTFGSNESLTLSWQAASDDWSGVKGYQLYLGNDAAGTDEWFVTETFVGVGTLKAGSYYLRARALDNAGNFSDWVTVEHFNVR